MNDNFKLIIIIASNIQSTKTKPNETSNSFLQEAIQYNIFTSYTPSNIIVATKNSVSGKYINESLFSKDDIYQFFLSNDSICFEFDEVYSEIHPIDLVFNINFPIEELTNKLNTCILFSSQDEIEKMHLYDNFISKFIANYFKLISTSKEDDSTENPMTISAYLMNQQKQFNLFYDKIGSLEQANLMIKAINEQREKYLRENSSFSENIIISLSIQVKCSEITFIKLNVKEPLASNNTLYYLTNDIATFVNLEKYEKVYLISCVNPNKDSLKKSIQELYFMNDIYKEINSAKANNSLHIPLLDSLRSLTSLEDMNTNMTGTNRRYVSQVFSNQSNQIENANTNNPNANNQNQLKHEQNISIIPPDCTISLSETNYHMKNTKSDVETLYSYLKSLSLNINEKNKFETKIKLLEEELMKERMTKGGIEVEYKVALEKMNELNKTLSTKDEMIHFLEQKNKKSRTERKELEELNKNNELRIIELSKDNEMLKVTNDNYSKNYITLKEDNINLEQRITSIQKKLELIMKNKETHDLK